MVNFRIVECNEKNDLEGIYSEFKEDFLNPNITVSRLYSKYGLSYRKYSLLRERVLEETGLSKKPSKTMKNTSTSIITDNTYIRQYKSGYYYILKKINGKRHHFGYYNDLDTVRFVRDELIEHDWDIGYHDFLREKYNGMKR